MPFARLVPSYHHHFGRQLRVSDYGHSKLQDLLESLTHIVEVGMISYLYKNHSICSFVVCLSQGWYHHTSGILADIGGSWTMESAIVVARNILCCFWDNNILNLVSYTSLLLVNYQIKLTCFFTCDTTKTKAIFCTLVGGRGREDG